MRLYIVRHGESVSNAERINQSPDSPLSKTGKKQAVALAKRVSKLENIDLIICSPYLRTRQTLEEILKVKKHKTVISDLAIEIVRPKEMIGTGWESLEANEIKKQMDEKIDDPAWHYSNEENFYDFKNRVVKLIKYIESFGDKNILLVTHGLTAKMIVGVLLFKEKITGKEYLAMDNFFKSRNTGITMIDKRKSGWQLITWNDHAHLG